MFDLTGKGALVTGASGGIGGAIARTLHKAGASVVLSGTKAEKLESLAADLGARAFIVPCDLTDRSALQKLAAESEAKLGTLDIVVNNAGMTKDNLFMRMKDEEWDQVIHLDLTAAFMISRSAIRNMMRRQWGRIVNIASISGIIGNPGQANYAAAKAGMIGMTKSVAREVASRGITANCIAPGFIQTAMTSALNEKQVAAIAEVIPSGKFGTVDDIAAATLYLASHEAKYVTGQTLHVNGGMVMV